MTPSSAKRKLAAILAADAFGYSRLMAADEEGTAKILAAHRAVIDGIIQFHEGRIVNTAGDSVLAEFASPVEAVRCAVEIQDALKTRNDSLPESQRMQFRIGVNLGDVMIRGEDLLGDGVNVAARLQGIAEPGQIFLSSSVYDQIAGKLDLGFADLGNQSLKNIDRPIRAYRVERAGRRVPAWRKPGRANATWIGLALGASGLALAYFGYLGLLPGQRPSASLPSAADVKAQAEAEIARARAETEAANRRAEAETAAAAEARRALEEQRAAEARSRAQADLARLRAEAETAKRQAEQELAAAGKARRSAEAEAAKWKAEQELAAAEKARRVAEGAATPATKPPVAAKAPAPGLPAHYQGPWLATFTCPAFQDRPASKAMAPFSVTGNVFELQYREPGQPGSFHLKGAPAPGGVLALSGNGISGAKESYGRSYVATFKAKLDGERFVGSGSFGNRDCTVSIARR
jgi:class 3 adenylate cyclase